MNAKQQEFYLKCRDDPVFFATEKFNGQPIVYIKHVSRGKIPLCDNIYDWQIDVLKRLHAGENLIINKSRRVGVSWISVVFVTWLIEFHANLESLFLSRGEKYAKNLLRKLKFCDKNLPRWMRREIGTDSTSRYSLIARDPTGDITGEAVVDSLTTTGGSGRGEGARFLLADEFAWMDDCEEVWAAVAPTTADGGQVVCASTPNGMANEFHRIWVEANQDPDGGFTPLEIHYTMCGHGDEWLKSASRGMTNTQRDQEFELEFLVAGTPAFNPTDVKACYMPPDEFPEVAKMIRESQKFFSGVDTAEGKTHGKKAKSLLPDYNSACVLNELGVQVYAEHNRDSLTKWAGWTDHDGDEIVEYPGRVSEIHAQFPGKMAIEKNGPGLVVLNRHVLPEDVIILNEDGKIVKVIVSEVVPLQTTEKSKPRLVSQLAYALESRQIIITDWFTYQCILAYQSVSSSISSHVRHEALTGHYDDPVVSLMIAYDLALKEGMYDLDWSKIYATGTRVSTKPPSERVAPIPMPDQIGIPEPARDIALPRRDVSHLDPWAAIGRNYGRANHPNRRRTHTR
jgi:hypothetical protein